MGPWFGHRPKRTANDVAFMAISIAGTDVSAGLDSTATSLDTIRAEVIGIVIGSPCIANNPASVTARTAAYTSDRSPGLRSTFASTLVITPNGIRMSVRICCQPGIGVDRRTLSE